MSKKPQFKHFPQGGALSTIRAAILDSSCLKSSKSELLASQSYLWCILFSSAVLSWWVGGGQFKLLLNRIYTMDDDNNNNNDDGMVTQIYKPLLLAAFQAARAA